MVKLVLILSPIQFQNNFYLKHCFLSSEYLLVSCKSFPLICIQIAKQVFSVFFVNFGHMENVPESVQIINHNEASFELFFTILMPFSSTERIDYMNELKQYKKVANSSCDQV